MTEPLAEALVTVFGKPWASSADLLRNALRERGVRLVTVKSLAKALCRRDDTPPGLGLDDMPGEVRASYLYNAEAILALEEET